MNNRQAYNQWSATYDEVLNKTRDLEAIAFRNILSEKSFADVLELGCGTGKNTEWLAAKSRRIVAVDFSEEMLSKAKSKIKDQQVQFIQMDLRKEWKLDFNSFDLVTCSLVLEHIKDLDHIFSQAKFHLKEGGLFYIGEFHPFKQYEGSKARYETSRGMFELECFVHHISDYMECARNVNFDCLALNEWFDEDDKNTTPRLVSFLFKKHSKK